MRFLLAILLLGAWPRESEACSYSPGPSDSSPADGVHPVAENGRIYIKAAFVQGLRAEMSYDGNNMVVPIHALAEPGAVDGFAIETHVPPDTAFSVRVSTDEFERTYQFVSGPDGPDRAPPSAATDLSIRTERADGVGCVPPDTWLILVEHSSVPEVGAYVLLRFDSAGGTAAIDSWVNTKDYVALYDTAPLEAEGQERCYAVQTLDHAGNASHSDPTCVRVGGACTPVVADR